MHTYRADRVIRFLTAIVSVAYFVMLATAVVLLIGLPIGRLMAGDDTSWEIGLPVPVAPLDSDATVPTRWGDARLEVENMHASLRLPVSELPWWLFAGLWAYMAATAALVLLFLHHLRRMFQRVRSGAPFDVANGPRLRWMGLLALAFALLKGVSELVTSLVIRGGGVTDDRVEVPLALSIDVWLVFFGLVLLALAEIFRRGAELEAEQSLTV